MNNKYVTMDQLLRMIAARVMGFIIFPVFAITMWISHHESALVSARDGAGRVFLQGSILLLVVLAATLLVNPVAHRLPGTKIWNGVLRIPAYAVIVFAIHFALGAVILARSKTVMH